jgi:hypothetical protein
MKVLLRALVPINTIAGAPVLIEIKACALTLLIDTFSFARTGRSRGLVLPVEARVSVLSKRKMLWH